MADRFDEAWEQEYAAGRSLNSYPFDNVVVLTSRYFGGVSEPANVRVLDLGAGAGNHALFFARLGFTVTCIDISASALRVARQRFEREGLSGEFHQLRFTDIGTLPASFDLILDRGALVCADFDDLRMQIMPAIRSRLKPSGLLFSFFFTDEYSARHAGDERADGYTDVGFLHNTGGPLRMTRVDRTGLDQLFQELEIVQLHRHTIRPLFVGDGEPPLGTNDEFIVVCRRGADPEIHDGE